MISTFKTTNQVTTSASFKNNTNVVKLPVVRAVKNLGQAPSQTPTEVRPANHNLTHDARRSNVVLLSHIQTTDDFPPNMGARPAIAA